MSWRHVALLGLAVVAAVVLLLIVRSCQPAPAVTSPLTVASDRVVEVDTHGGPAKPDTPTVATLAVTSSRGVISVEGNDTGVTVKQSTPAVRVVQQQPSGQRTVVAETPAGTPETATVDPGGGIVVTSTPEPVTITIKASEPSRVGVILGALPGVVAVDVAVFRGRPLQALGLDLSASLDLMAGPGSVGAGLALGDKFFVTGGAAIDWAGELSPYVAGGIRF